jgi:DNA polymerase-3 subunit beta
MMMIEANAVRSVRVDTRIMARAIDRAGRVVERRSTIPILGMIQVNAQKRRLTVSATDLDVSYSAAVAAEASGKGRLLLDKEDASRIFKRAPSSHVELCPKGGVVEASGDGFAASIESIVTTDNLPLVIDGDDTQAGPTIIVEAKALRAALDDAKHAISDEETRYYLNGVYLVPAEKGRSLEAVSTDGHRMMMAPLPYRYPPKGSRSKVMKEGGIIVPRKTVSLLLALAPSGEEPITVSFWRRTAQKGKATRVRFEWRGEKIETKLIDGTYPDYKRVVPAVGMPGNKSFRVVIDQTKTMAAIDTCMSLAGAKMGLVKLSAQDDGKLSLDLMEDSKSKARTSADAIVDGNLKFPIAFNAKYLVDALRRFSGSVDIWLLDPGSPAVIRQGEMLMPDRRAILMPARCP